MNSDTSDILPIQRVKSITLHYLIFWRQNGPKMAQILQFHVINGKISKPPCSYLILHNYLIVQSTNTEVYLVYLFMYIHLSNYRRRCIAKLRNGRQLLSYHHNQVLKAVISTRSLH